MNAGTLNPRLKFQTGIWNRENRTRFSREACALDWSNAQTPSQNGRPILSIPIAERAIEIERGADQCKVCEGLWKVAERLPLRAGLFCEQPEVIGVSQHALEDQSCLIQFFGDFLARPRQRFDEPERTHIKCAFLARKPINAGIRRIAVNQ